ncbi:MAG: cupin domain-containing protein [bacterium]|nr:cupin domain-containing protein [bacterium]
MADFTVKRIEEMENIWEGLMVRARASLGVTSFGMQVLNLPPGFEQYPEHDEEESGQEEVYVAMKGSGRLVIGGEDHKLEPGVFARVASGTSRRVFPGNDGLQLLVIGGVPGKGFEPGSWTELGAELPTHGES